VVDGAAQVAEEMFCSLPVSWAQLGHKAAQDTNGMHNIWAHGNHEVHQRSKSTHIVSQIYREVSGERVFTRQTRRRTPGTAKTLEAPYLGRRTGKHISTGFGSTMLRAIKAVRQKLRLKPAPSTAMSNVNAYAEELTSVFGFSFPLPPVYLNARLTREFIPTTTRCLRLSLLLVMPL
jgi:hypothetical protein